MGELDRFELSFANGVELTRAYEAELRHGRARVPGFSFVEIQGVCTLAVRRDDTGAELELPARVVAIDYEPPGSVELELLSAAGLERLVTSETPRRANRHDKLRQLKLHEQQRLARNGELQDRVTLERIYGKNVWESLLHNPRLTIPEVARIARKGTVPKPLLDLIVDNKAWTKTAPVRRALLSNPRIGSDSVIKILKLTPKRELKLMQNQMGYPALVRDAARRMLR